MADYDEYDLEKIRKFLGYEPKIVFCFDRAFPAWECDSKGWIIEDNLNHKSLILTNHGTMYFGKIEELDEDLKRYTKLFTDTISAQIHLQIK